MEKENILLDILLYLYMGLSFLIPILIDWVYSSLLPPLEIESMREKVKCICAFLQIKFDPEAPLPTLQKLSKDDIIIDNPKWDDDEHDLPTEVYHHEWRRIFLYYWVRQDTYYHALAHYVQFQYGRVFENETAMEENAWACARHLMMIFHPQRNQVLYMLFGWCGIWQVAVEIR